MEKGVNVFLDDLREQFQLGHVDLRTYSPLTLAYMGDAVYELVIRTIVVSQGNSSPNKLHQRASAIVKASAQAELAEHIFPLLKEEEAQIYQRGCNAKPYSIAKNASKKDYCKATGLETLIGYLYLQENMSRVLELMKAGLKCMDNKYIHTILQ